MFRVWDLKLERLVVARQENGFSLVVDESRGNLDYYLKDDDLSPTPQEAWRKYRDRSRSRLGEVEALRGVVFYGSVRDHLLERVREAERQLAALEGKP